MKFSVFSVISGVFGDSGELTWPSIPTFVAVAGENLVGEACLAPPILNRFKISIHSVFSICNKCPITEVRENQALRIPSFSIST